MPQLLTGFPPPGGRAEDSLPSGGAGCSLSIPTQEPACYGFTEQHESPSTGYACPMDSRCCLPHLDNPIQPTWTLASEPCLRESLSSTQEPAGVQVCVGLHRCFHTSRVARLPLECWRELRAAPDLCALSCPRPSLPSGGNWVQWKRGPVPGPVGKGAGSLPCLPPSKLVLKLP